MSLRTDEGITLDGNDRVVTRTYHCLVKNEDPQQIELSNGQMNSVLITESSRAIDQEFLNFYWMVSSNGRTVQSRQCAGPEIASISTHVVSR